jgi:hypothetical protein
MKACVYVVEANCGKKGTATEYLRAGGQKRMVGDVVWPSGRLVWG